jgi:hypothetical protein
METSKLSIIFVVVLVSASHVHLSNMQKPAWQVLVESVKGIKGGIFPLCEVLKSGGDKYACRLKQFPEIGFLFCKKAIIGNDKCEALLTTEVQGLKYLRTKQIKTVNFQPDLIPGVMCPDSSPDKGTCSGFFEKWVDKNVGRFFHVSVYADDNTLDEEMTEIIQKSNKDSNALQETINDLERINQFMTNGIAEKADHYRCICDLQGFFIFEGGFLVSDTAEGIMLVHKHKSCPYGGPTAAKLLFAVRMMIIRIKQAIKLGTIRNGKHIRNNIPILRTLNRIS